MVGGEAAEFETKALPEVGERFELPANVEEVAVRGDLGTLYV